MTRVAQEDTSFIGKMKKSVSPMSAICYFLYLLNSQSAKFKPFAEVNINLCGIVLLAPILGFKELL